MSQFAPFLKENLAEPAIRQIVKEAFTTFFNKQKSYYPGCDTLPWHFTGSVAAHFEEVLREAAEEAGCEIGEIAGDPMERLIGLKGYTVKKL